MLVLTRRPGEEVVIDGQIRIAVIGIQGGRVRIGVTAPAGVRVDRAEVARRVAGLPPEAGAADRLRELATAGR